MKFTSPALPAAYSGTSCQADLMRPPAAASVKYNLKVLAPYWLGWRAWM